MNKRLVSLLRLAVVGCVAAALPVLAQNGQPDEHARPAHGGQQASHPQQGAHAPANRPTTGANRPQQTGGQRPTQPHPAPQHPTTRPATRPNAVRPQPARPPVTSRPPARPGQRPPQHGTRPPQWGHRPQNRPPYQFRPANRGYLRSYYLSRLGAINRARRPRFLVGGFFPFAYISYLSPVPPSLWAELPPIPPGYEVGYYDGYVIVYDPVTYYIAGVIDLM